MKSIDKKKHFKSFRCCDLTNQQIEFLTEDLRKTTGIESITEGEIIRKSINHYYIKRSTDKKLKAIL